MGDLHFHVTSFLNEDQAAITRFIDAAREHFRTVWPLPPEGGDVFALALHSKDFDGISDELDMPDVAEALSGILVHDTVIVSAWDLNWSDGAGEREREHVWRVKGGG